MNFKPGDVVRNFNSQNDGYYYDIVVTEIISNIQFKGYLIYHSLLKELAVFNSILQFNSNFTYVCKVQDYVKGQSNLPNPPAHKFKPYDVVKTHHDGLRIIVIEADPSNMEFFTGICVADYTNVDYDNRFSTWRTDCFKLEYSLTKYFVKE